MASDTKRLESLRFRGDLHTLKKVCRYASIVMLAGEAAFIILAAAMIVSGAYSFVSDGFKDTFIDIIRSGDSDASLIAGTLELTLTFLGMFVTVKVIHDIMVSIQNEHSPFMEENSKGFKTVCMTFLILSAPLCVLEYINRSDAILAICVLLVCILICVVMYCLTIIFRYGSALQDESDHTL